MYDHPALRADLRVYWRIIKDELTKIGVAAPDQLSSNGIGVDFWTRNDLVLSQTCGYPYRTRLFDKVAYVGTPDYGVEGCASGHYRSVVVVRRDSRFRQLQDLDGARFAFNDTLSQSGYHALFAAGRNVGIRILPALETGSHRSSITAVGNGDADFAAIDAVSWRFFQQFEPVAAQLTVIARTAPTPGLPYICATSIDEGLVAEAVGNAIERLPAETKGRLGLIGLVDLGPEAYLETGEPGGDNPGRYHPNCDDPSCDNPSPAIH